MANDKMSLVEIVEEYDERINDVDLPDYGKELKKLSQLVIEIPGNEIDPDIIITLLDNCIRYRNVLLRKKILWGRKALRLKRYAESLRSIVKGMVSGTAQEKEGKATQILEKYMDKVEDAEVAHQTIREFLDNIDQAALQLSRMLRVMDQPFTRVTLAERGGSTDKLVALKQWGHSQDDPDKLDE